MIKNLAKKADPQGIEVNTKKSYKEQQLEMAFPSMNPEVSGRSRWTPLHLDVLFAVLMILLPLCLCFDTFAQSNILGNTRFGDGSLGYAINQTGQSVNISPVGYIGANDNLGHLVGRFGDGSGKSLIKVKRISSERFSFAIKNSRGAKETRRLTLSHAVGPRYYLLTGFDLSKDGHDDIAIVDISKNPYYWTIVENPASDSIRERESFLLGFAGDRVELTNTTRRGVEFVALRQTINTPRTRILLRSSITNKSRAIRFRWADPKGILIATRLPRNSGFEVGLGLYSPVHQSLIIPNRTGAILELSVPDRRCSGYQAVTGANTRGSISALELCRDGAFFLTQRDNNLSSSDLILSSGNLPAPLSGARRSDQTLIIDAFGEAALPILQPGSDGSELLAPGPLPAPGREMPTVPPATPTMSPTDTPQDTETPTITPTSTVTATSTYTATPTPPPVPFIFTIDTSKTSTGSTDTTQFKLPLIPVGSYDFTVDWGDGSSDRITSYDSSLSTHTYSSSGVYQVSITGRCEGWQFNNAGDRLKMKDIVQWGNSLRLVDTDQNLREYLHKQLLDIQAMEFAGGYIWAGLNSSPAELIRLNRSDGTTAQFTFGAGENQIRGMTTMGGSLFVPTMSGQVVHINATSGARTASWDLSSSATQLVDATNDGTNVWIIAQAPTPQLIKINPSSGSISNFPLNGTKNGKAILYANNKIWISTADGTAAAQIIRVDPSSGAFDLISIPTATDIKGLTTDGNAIWGITGESPSKLVRVIPTTLEATVYTLTSDEAGGNSIVFDGEWLWVGLGLGSRFGWVSQYVSKIDPTDVTKRALIRVTRFQSSEKSITDLAFDGFSIWAGTTRTPDRTSQNPSVTAVNKNSWSQGLQFSGCANLNITASDAPDLSQTKSLESIFLNCTSLNTDLSNWDVSKISDFSSAFKGCTSFNNGDNTKTNPLTLRTGLGAWNTSNGEAFDLMFEGSTAFNRELSTWDMSKALSIACMFRSATAYNNAPNTEINPQTGRQGIEGWDTGKVMSFFLAFGGASSFSRTLANWNTGNGVDFFAMFSGARAFNQPLNSWNVSNAQYLGFMFLNASAFNQPLDNWSPSKAVSFRQMFKLATSFNQNINSWNTSNATDMSEMFDRSAFNSPLNNWDTSKVTNFSVMLSMPHIPLEFEIADGRNISLSS